MMQAMVTRSEPLSELKDDQIDFERVVSDPEYRRHVIVYLNAQARSHEGVRGQGRTSTHAKLYRAELAGRPALRRIG